MSTGSLSLGFDSSGRIDSAVELISYSYRFLLYENLYLGGTLRKRERAHELDEKSIPASKI
jgi:hypothetical protein